MVLWICVNVEFSSEVSKFSERVMGEERRGGGRQREGGRGREREREEIGKEMEKRRRMRQRGRGGKERETNKQYDFIFKNILFHGLRIMHQESGVGGGNKEEVKTGRSLFQNPCENDGLDCSADRNREKRENVRSY